MKILLLLTLILTSTFGITQGLDDIKYDSIVKIKNTDINLIYSKKKTAVWHDAGFYVVQPTKNYFIFLEAAELLVEVDFKQKAFYAIVEDKNTGGYKHFHLANNKFEGAMFRNYDNSYILCVDSSNYNNQFTITDPHSCSADDGVGKISLIIKDQLLFVTDYRESQEIFSETPIESIEFPGEDSILFIRDGYYETVYPANEIIPGHSNSGVYNFKTKTWTIAPKYHRLQQINNKVLVSEELDEYKKLLDSLYEYKLFQIKKNEVTMIQGQIITNNSSIVEQMTNYDSIQQLVDKVHYITYKNGKQGLMKFQLFDEVYDHYEQTYETGWVSFDKEIIFKPEYDFVYYSTSSHFHLVKSSTNYSISDNLGDLKRDSIIYGSGRITEEFGNWSSELFFNQINDSILLIKDFTSEYYSEVPYVDINGYDSISFYDENGDYLIIYPAPEPGQYHCGVYNLNQNKWIIKPNEFDIQYLGGNHFIIEKPRFNENHIIQSKGYKSIYDFNGNELETNLTPLACISNQHTIEKLVLQKNESISPFQISTYSNKNIPDSLFEAPYYFKKHLDNKEHVFALNLQNTHPVKNNLTEFHDMVLYDVESEIELFLDHQKTTLIFPLFLDSLQPKLPHSFTTTDEVYEMDIYTIMDYNAFSSALIVYRSQGDTTLVEFGYTLNVDIDDTLTFYQKRTNHVISLNKSYNELVYSHPKTIKKSYSEFDSNDFGDESGNDRTYEWEQEFSSIYRKIDAKWVQVSPNYAAVTKTPLGYICKTGSYNYMYSKIWGGELITEKSIASTYILLDSTLKPIGYSDFYNFDLIEDLGFGLKICAVIDVDKWNTSEQHGNCFFVDYSGKPLCDAKFDNFQLVDGKLYGIKDEIYKMDEESGELFYEEYGNPVLLQAYERVLIGEIKK